MQEEPKGSWILKRGMLNMEDPQNQFQTLVLNSIIYGYFENFLADPQIRNPFK